MEKISKEYSKLETEMSNLKNFNEQLQNKVKIFIYIQKLWLPDVCPNDNRTHRTVCRLGKRLVKKI